MKDRLEGTETIDIEGPGAGMEAGQLMTMRVTPAGGGESRTFQVKSRVDTPAEVDYYVHGGILQYVLRQLASQ